MPDLDPSIDARVRRLLRAAPLPADFGIEAVSLEPGRVVLSMPWNERLGQYQGILHGGAITTLLDTAATMAFITRLDERRDVVTIELKVNFFAPVDSGPILSEGRVVHAGRRTAVAEADLAGPSGRLAARGTFTALIIEAANGPEGNPGVSTRFGRLGRPGGSGAGSRGR